MVILICGVPFADCPTRIIIGLLSQMGQLMGEVIHIIRLVYNHRRGTEVDEESAAIA